MRFPTLGGAAAAATIVAVFGLGVACRRSRPAGKVGRATVELAGAEVGGCEEVRGGERCAVEPGATLVLWLPLGPEDSVVLPAGATAQRVAEGLQIRLTVADPRVPLQLEGDHGPRHWRWRVALEPLGQAPALKAALDLQRAGRADEALATIDRVWAALAASDRARAEVVRAQIAEIRGQTDRALEGRARAIDEAVRAGIDSRAVKQHVARVFTLLYGRHELAQARRELAAAERLRIDPTRRAEVELARGWLAEEGGEMGTALAALAAAAAHADRLDRRAIAFAARSQRAALLGRLGRFDEALGGFRTLAGAAAAEDDCAQAKFWTSFAWQKMMVVEAGATAAADTGDESPRAQLERALSLERRCRRGTPEVPNVHVNLALAEAQAGRWRQARVWLRDETLTRAPVRLMVELWRQELEARVALASGAPGAALATYRRLQAQARAAALTEVHWQALVGTAHALRALGRRPAAIAAYRQAEALLDDQLVDVPLGQGRGAFLAARERATGELVEELLAAGRAREAIEIARRSRLRSVERLDRQARLAALPPAERQRWDLAVGKLLGARDAVERIAEARWALPASQLVAAGADYRRHEEEARAALASALDVLGRTGARDAEALRPPGPGEVILGYHALPPGPDGSPRWFGYALSGAQILTADLTAAVAGRPPDALARALLAPFAPLLASAARIRILPARDLQAVDFHALPFDGRPLIAGRPVLYSVDLPVRPATGPARHLAKAVVVADPRGDLPQARREGDEVLAQLRPRFARIAALLGAGAETVTSRLRAELRGADLFHYAGHARQAGTDSMESALNLSAGQELSIADVLTLEQAPAAVVLSGCETGLGDRRAVADLGLAQAFVLAGATLVVASTRRVDDGTTRALMTLLYQHRSEDLAAALQVAQGTLLARSDHLDWSAFRAIVR